MKRKEIYVGLTFFIVGLLYFLYQFDFVYFSKIIKYWPIFILIAGAFMEFIIISGTNNILSILIAGVFLVYGIMYTLNIYYEFSHWSAHLATFFLSISAAILNTFVFYKKNDLILPFIFLLILLSIITFLFPVYIKYFPLVNFENILPILFMLLGLLIIFKGFTKTD